MDTIEQRLIELQSATLQALQFDVGIPSDPNAVTALSTKYFNQFRKAVAPEIDAQIQAIDRLAVPSHSLEFLSRQLRTYKLVNGKQHIPLIKRLLEVGRENDAAQMIDVALASEPLSPGFFNLALSLVNEELRQEIIDRHFSELANKRATSAPHLSLLSKQLVLAGRYRECIALDGRAIEQCVLEKLNPTNALTYFHAKALAHFWLDEFKESLEHCTDALNAKSDPTFKEAAAVSSLVCQIHLTLGKPELARSELQDLHMRFPDEVLRNNRIALITEIAAGNLTKAFSCYLGSLKSNQLELAGLPVLNIHTGESGDVRLPDFHHSHCTVVCSMGLGDEIRFARMLPALSEDVDSLTVLCDHRLVKVYERTFPQVNFHGIDRAASRLETNNPLVGLANLDQRSVLDNAQLVADLRHFTPVYHPASERVARNHALIKVDEAKRDCWNIWLNQHVGAVATGFFWRSNINSYVYDHKKSRLTDWLPLITSRPHKFVCLQYDLQPDEIELIASHDQLILPPGIDLKNDVDSIFALLSALELVVALPGTLQHMAGSVGTRTLCPCHPFEAQWRKAPSYLPTMRGRTVPHELWAPSVDIITAEPTAGLKGAIEATFPHIDTILNEDQIS